MRDPWRIEEYKHEILRLESLLRNPNIPPDERAIAQSSLAMTLDEYADELEN